MKKPKSFHFKLEHILFLQILLILLGGVALPGYSILVNDGFMNQDSFVHIGNRTQNFRNFLFHIALLFLFILFGRQIYSCLVKISNFINKNKSQKNWVYLILFFSLLLLTTYSFRGHIIVSSKGVPGWHYTGYSSKLTSRPKLQVGINHEVPLESIQKSINHLPIKYLSKGGFITGNVALLHFEGGIVLPFNFGLTANSWPLDIFSIKNGTFEYSSQLLRLLKHSLKKRKAGYKSLLPLQLSFPNHVNFQFINYKNYPAAKSLIGISYWETEIYVDLKRQKINVTGAKRIAQATADN